MTDVLRPPSAPVTPHTIAGAGLCIGCGSCVAQTQGASMVWDRYGQLKPAGGELLDNPPAHFTITCPFAPDAANEDALAAALFPAARHVDREIGRFDGAYVGHVREGDFRLLGSSGGMVSWMAAELIKRGLVDAVAHVSAAPDPHREGRFFRYVVSETVDEVRAGACSRYYPTHLSDVLQIIRTRPGRYAVVGVPCFVKAINLLRSTDSLFRERIAFTLGLFCGHMKSARFLDSLALQMGIDPSNATSAEFRVKTPGRPANWYRARLASAGGECREKDWWDLVDGDWGAGFFQNSACNFCDDVVAETADISFGDAWVEPYASDPGGTNVVVVRDMRLADIVGEAMCSERLDLRPVDADFIRRTQAAGLRQRREGLAYRLAWRPPRVQVVKRMAAMLQPLPWRRRLIYRTRLQISVWSHRMFLLARLGRTPKLYERWAAASLGFYQALAYSRGRFGTMLDRLMKPRT